MITDHDEWTEYLAEHQRQRLVPRLPDDWTIFPLRAMATIKCYLCEEVMHKNGRPAMGPRYKRLVFNWGRGIAIPLDLFSVIHLASWGVLFTIRTGPAEFSKRIVTRRESMGKLPDWMRVRDGGLWTDEPTGEQLRALDPQVYSSPPWPIFCPEERDFFRAIGLDWIEPWDRK